ncbi:MAG: transglutaminase family protein [Myxococcota bacterium]|nr:transglutaminase family protein [Myxococcota bacterium]
MHAELRPFLEPSPTVESRNPQVEAFARAHSGNAEDPRERAVALYFAVRDGIRYDPYTVDVSVEGLRAGATLASGRGWCVSKAILLAACCRALGIPARLGFADVRNHLSTERMRRHMATDVFYWHGYASIHLGGAWVKATPAFNIELCEKFRLAPLDFDGREDSIYHPFDLEGNRHMEYLSQRGEFADVPLEAMLATFREFYPDMGDWGEADFDRDVERETAER